MPYSDTDLLCSQLPGPVDFPTEKQNRRKHIQGWFDCYMVVEIKTE